MKVNKLLIDTLKKALKNPNSILYHLDNESIYIIHDGIVVFKLPKKYDVFNYPNLNIGDMKSIASLFKHDEYVQATLNNTMQVLSDKKIVLKLTTLDYDVYFQKKFTDYFDKNDEVEYWTNTPKSPIWVNINEGSLEMLILPVNVEKENKHGY